MYKLHCSKLWIRRIGMYGLHSSIFWYDFLFSKWQLFNRNCVFRYQYLYFIVFPLHIIYHIPTVSYDTTDTHTHNRHTHMHSLENRWCFFVYVDWSAVPPRHAEVNPTLWPCCVALVQGNILPPPLPTCKCRQLHVRSFWKGCHVLPGCVRLVGAVMESRHTCLCTLFTTAIPTSLWFLWNLFHYTCVDTIIYMQHSVAYSGCVYFIDSFQTLLHTFPWIHLAKF